ncbi:3-isopropylmalate dehydrogenase, partial [Candidatus Peregrinibacteria bacterium RIFOXYB2_FULL_32_7]
MYKISILSGDGIGPEVMEQTLRILDKIAAKYNHQFEYKPAFIGGVAYDKFGKHFPDETKEICQNSDAILFGSVGGPVSKLHEPKWATCERDALLGIRKTFNFHCNLRPAKVYPELANICPLKKEIVDQGIDLIVVRELLGGLYFGKHEILEENGQRLGRDIMEYREEQIKLIAHDGFKIAQKRSKHLTSVDKANVLDCSKLWRQIIEEVAKEYKDVQYNHMLVDNAAMQLIKNPAQFDVILTENTFGDILSDSAAVLPGSLGLMASASLNKDDFSMYEPSGGSAQDIAGKGIANPIAQILSAAMMLKYSFNLLKEANVIENAVNKTLKDGFRTSDIYSDGTKKVGSKEMTDEI